MDYASRSWTVNEICEFLDFRFRSPYRSASTKTAISQLRFFIPDHTTIQLGLLNFFLFINQSGALESLFREHCHCERSLQCAQRYAALATTSARLPELRRSDNVL